MGVELQADVTRYLRIADVSDQLGLCTRTVQRYIKSGALPAIKLKRAVLIDPADVVTFLQTYEPEPDAVPTVDSQAAEIRDLLMRLESVSAMHRPVEDMGSSHPRCDVCPVAWPCPTYRAVTIPTP